MQRKIAVGLEVVAKIIARLVAHVFGLRFFALIILGRIEEAAVFATVYFGFAMRAFVAAKNFADNFVIASTVVTNHILFGAQDGVLCLTSLSTINSL
ncbi:MAG: hypothetical protein HOP19_29015 [Acidobacteria bacterium]|nr:hypothetical protein [Acidobacteriota bacterium]